MAKYNFWYKKVITADNIDKAIQKERKIRPQFDSIRIVEEGDDKIGANAIGFEA